ncbi:MAG: FAD-dependent oxidoreductase [Pseudomonadota bacterium]
MAADMTVDVCVIGAGAAGLVSTSGAAQLGLKTVLIEAGEMGGECLNNGCVPSKAILSAAHAAHDAGGADAKGVTRDGDTAIDFAAVMAHVRSAITAIEPHDSQERFEGLGAIVLRDWARFSGPRTVEVGGQTIRFKKAVIATGSRPFIPPISGIEDTPYLTNETLWALKELPEHLLIIGGGAIGCEMAQAFARLGSRVSVFEHGTILGRVDPDGAQLLRETLAEEGVQLHEATSVTATTKTEDGLTLTYEKDGESNTVKASHLLVAAGRTVATDSLNLEAAGVSATPRGIEVDESLCTSNKRIYALGDCNGQYQLTHAAGHEAGHFIKSGLFKVPGKIGRSGMPHVTFTDPEVAQVGMTHAQALEEHGSAVQVVTADYASNDRAITEGQRRGFAKLILKKGGKVLGATIVGAHAGELIHLWSLAIAKGLKPRDLAGYIAPYPTYSELNKALINAYYKDALSAPLVQRVVKALNLW